MTGFQPRRIVRRGGNFRGRIAWERNDVGERTRTIVDVINNVCSLVHKTIVFIIAFAATSLIFNLHVAEFCFLLAHGMYILY